MDCGWDHKQNDRAYKGVPKMSRLLEKAVEYQKKRETLVSQIEVLEGNLRVLDEQAKDVFGVNHHGILDIPTLIQVMLRVKGEVEDVQT